MKIKFFGKKGGVSMGKYSSLNTNNESLDSAENVAQNMEIIANEFGLKTENIALQNQGFTNIANYINEPAFYKTTGDGLVTDKKNIVLAIRTADCTPVLFYDKKNQIIGGAHAGWRSALAGVIENTIDLMIEKGATPKNIKATVGPCLQMKSFAAGEDMKQKFVEKDSEYAKYFIPHNDKYLFNIKDFVIDRLKEKDIENIEYLDIDTYSDENYFSYRKSGHNGEISKAGDFGTQLSCICL